VSSGIQVAIFRRNLLVSFNGNAVKMELARLLKRRVPRGRNLNIIKDKVHPRKGHHDPDGA
jgi:hypothetical protein